MAQQIRSRADYVAALKGCIATRNLRRLGNLVDWGRSLSLTYNELMAMAEVEPGLWEELMQEIDAMEADEGEEG